MSPQIVWCHPDQFQPVPPPTPPNPVLSTRCMLSPRHSSPIPVPPAAPCPHRKPTEVAWRYTEEGERVRVSLRSGRILPLPPYQRRDGIVPDEWIGERGLGVGGWWSWGAASSPPGAQRCPPPGAPRRRPQGHGGEGRAGQDLPALPATLRGGDHGGHGHRGDAPGQEILLVLSGGHPDTPWGSTQTPPGGHNKATPLSSPSAFGAGRTNPSFIVAFAQGGQQGGPAPPRGALSPPGPRPCPRPRRRPGPAPPAPGPVASAPPLAPGCAGRSGG